VFDPEHLSSNVLSNSIPDNCLAVFCSIVDTRIYGYQLFKVSQYLRGWINYFGIANAYQTCVELDHWLRRRVRMCYWRQWRQPRTKVQNLLKRGVRIQAAVACGITSKGQWLRSKTLGIQQTLNNGYLVKAGLYSLRGGWIKVHCPNQSV
jgi:RNA-directed DNA polymerase